MKRGFPLLILFFFGYIGSETLMAQNTNRVTSLYEKARTEAFQKKYDVARKDCEQILSIDSNYYDARVLLGRIYSWQKNYTKAGEELNKVLDARPKYYDALSAYVDVLWWKGESQKALTWVNKALMFYPQNKDLLYKKARILLSLKKEKDAQGVLSHTLEMYPKDTLIKSLLATIKKSAVYNTLSWETSFEFFRKPYDSRLYLNDLAYTRRTGIGAVTANFYMADLVLNEEHLLSKGVDKLFEFTAYPVLGKKNYAYVSYGFSGSKLLPRQKAGLEIHQKLNHVFDVSLGTRFMQFHVNPDSLLNIYILTASIDKYYRNYWFRLRAYFTPHTSGWDHSLFLTIRRYFNIADNYVNLDFSMGNTITRLNDYLFPLEVYRLNSVNFIFTGQYRLNTSWSLKGAVGLKNTQYDPNNYRTAFFSSIRLNFSF